MSNISTDTSILRNSPLLLNFDLRHGYYECQCPLKFIVKGSVDFHSWSCMEFDHSYKARRTRLVTCLDKYLHICN